MSDRRQRFDDQRYVHFITFSVDRKRRLLDLDQPKRIVLGVLNHLLDAMSAQCVGFVLMPDHVHALVGLSDSRDLTRFLHGWKRMSSFRVRQWYAEHAPNYFDGFGPGDKFWQPKSYVFHVYNERKLREKLDYMHLNPVRAGLVQRAEQWPWSSARWYLRKQSVGVPITWPD
jgi:REP-associated tyrosine transposase